MTLVSEENRKKRWIRNRNR